MQYFTTETDKPVAIFLADNFVEASKIASGEGPRGEDFRRHIVAHGYTVTRTHAATPGEIELFETKVADGWLRCERAGVIGQYDKDHFVAWLEPFAPVHPCTAVQRAP